MNTLPRAKEAVIPIEKFTKYALNPAADNDKTVAFDRALGYNLHNAHCLVENIRANLTNFPAIDKEDTIFGKRYEVSMNLVGENGRSAKVLTAWIDDIDNGEMRLVTAYVDK